MASVFDLQAWAALGGVALSGFGAATLIPFQSEIVFVGVLVAGGAPVWAVIVAASVGNTLGSMVNWWMGLFLERFLHRRWFPFTEAQILRARDWYARWGVWSLLLSWAPFGDPLTLAAGVMRTPLWLFTLVVGIAKTGRYIVVAWLVEAGGWS